MGTATPNNWGNFVATSTSYPPLCESCNGGHWPTTIDCQRWMIDVSGNLIRSSEEYPLPRQ